MKRKTTCFAGLLLSLIFLFCCGFVKADSGYLKSATYYSDDWVCNFWNSESDNMEAELAQIRADGFNSIILVLPWREFQPGDGSYNSYAFEKLDKVMNAAAAQGLSVSLRVGYTWDYADGTAASTRVDRLPFDEQTRNDWFAYLKKVYTAASAHENFAGGFMTWEDFWTFMSSGSTKYGNNAEGYRYAKVSGYTDFALKNYSIEELQTLYHDDNLSKGTIYFPNRASQARKVVYQWYDSFLMQLLSESQKYFPNLSYEARLDYDRVNNMNGGSEVVTHESTYGAANASYTSAMYSIPMGQDTEGQKIDAGTALNSMRSILANMQQTAGKKIYVEQLLFTDNTLGYEKNAQLAESEKPVFLRSAADILRTYTNGYGIWTYRDYGNNKLFNAQFALGKNGWKFEGKADVKKIDGTNAAVLTQGDAISQGCADSAGTQNGSTTTVKVTLGGQGKVKVTLDGTSRVFNVKEKHNESFTVSGNPNSIRFESISGRVTVDNVYVYNFVTEGKLYHEDGSADSCIAALRELNAKLG